MTNAYDLKDLAQRLEKAGVPMAKDTAEKLASVIYFETKAWLKESATVSENKWDDFVAGFYDQADAVILPQIDKINGKVG